MKVGTKVRVTERVIEENFMGHALWEHALPDDIGSVEHVDDFGVPTVRFYRTGTSTPMFPGEDCEVMAEA